jgi:Galactose oxidase, central domain
MYGGEWFDGANDKMFVYGDLHIYDASKNRWRKVEAPNGYAAPASRLCRIRILHFSSKLCLALLRSLRSTADVMEINAVSWLTQGV